ARLARAAAARPLARHAPRVPGTLSLARLSARAPARDRPRLPLAAAPRPAAARHRGLLPRLPAAAGGAPTRASARDRRGDAALRRAPRREAAARAAARRVGGRRVLALRLAHRLLLALLPRALGDRGHDGRARLRRAPRAAVASRPESRSGGRRLRFSVWAGPHQDFAEIL